MGGWGGGTGDGLEMLKNSTLTVVSSSTGQTQMYIARF